MILPQELLINVQLRDERIYCRRLGCEREIGLLDGRMAILIAVRENCLVPYSTLVDYTDQASPVRTTVGLLMESYDFDFDARNPSVSTGNHSPLSLMEVSPLENDVNVEGGENRSNLSLIREEEPRLDQFDNGVNAASTPRRDQLDEIIEISSDNSTAFLLDGEVNAVSAPRNDRTSETIGNDVAGQDKKKRALKRVRKINEKTVRVPWRKLFGMKE